MRLRVPLLIPALAAAVLGIGASGASAATLFTTAAHTTRVAIGDTAGATSTSSYFVHAGPARINSCTHRSVHLVLDENGSSRVKETVIADNTTPCVSPMTSNTSPAWSLTITGTGTASGGFTRWSAAIDGVSFNLLGGTYTGNITTGVTVTQPTAAGSPICLHMNTAASVAGPLTGDGRLTGTFCLTGAAAAYSLTN